MSTTMRELDNFYLERFIESLESDTDKWTMSHHGGYSGHWVEYHGPTYTNESGVRLTFAQTLNYLGAYVDGVLVWQVPFRYRINIFSYKVIRFHRALRVMKDHCKEVDKKNRMDRLMKSL